MSILTHFENALHDTCNDHSEQTQHQHQKKNHPKSPPRLAGAEHVLSQEDAAAHQGAGAVVEVELTSGDMVEIRKAEAQTRIIKLNQDSFLETLRRKMKGN